MANTTGNIDKILDTAVELAERSSWEQLYLHQIANAMGITLDEIHRHFKQKDDMVEAWYDRADKAMLHASQSAEFTTLSFRDRLQLLIMAWLDFLAMHKKVSRDMLLYKLEPAHIHLHIQGLLRISRTVQWMREAARLDSTHFQRIAEEIGLTGIFVKTVVFWIFDQSEQHLKTRHFLDKKLCQAEKLANSFFCQTRTSASRNENNVTSQPN